jgi:hypothetical protein
VPPGIDYARDLGQQLAVGAAEPELTVGQAPRRSRGNARAVVEDGLAGLIGGGERRGIDVDHHLIPLRTRAAVQLAERGGRVSESVAGVV